VINGFDETHTVLYIFHAPVSKLGRETPSRIRAWSLICNKKTIVLFERHCHATEKSEAIACARRCWSSRLTRWWTQKDQSEQKWRAEEERGTGVTDQKNKKTVPL
jgi:hypothetical protein